MTRRDDHASDPEPIERILSRVLAESQIMRPDQHAKVASAWREVAGPGVREMTKVISFRKGILKIGVESAPLFQELETFRAGEILSALRERLQGVRVDEIRYRLV